MRFLPSEQEEAAGVAARWKAQYFRNGKWGQCHGNDASGIYDKLAAMPAGATGADVAAITGNDLWIGESCSECRGRAVVLVGQEPDYESHTVYLCASCVAKLARLLKLLPPEEK